MTQAPPATVPGEPIVAPGPAMSMTFKAMASNVTVQIVDPSPTAAVALDAARQVFARVEAACTRFDPASPLMLANQAGTDWYQVPGECYQALVEAEYAHRLTDGLFDPRVLQTLVGLGYDRTLPFADGTVSLSSGGSNPAAVPAPFLRPGAPNARPVDAEAPETAPREPWTPMFDAASSSVAVGPQAIDLGGIGKGLAVRWAAQALRGAGRAHLIEAGGDCHLGGEGPELEGWRVAVEDPAGGAEPVAVLCLADAGCATSSLRIRSWQRDGRPVHHLIDPRTGRSAAGGLTAVTVVDADPALAEVWSKALLVAGRDEIGPLADAHGLAALWIGTDGVMRYSRAMEPALIWVRAGVR
jgi:FAD:protein FMN transferase